MSDFGASLIARAIRFLGFCLFYGMCLKASSNPQKAIDTIEREYAKS
jgi:hypothetical protein